LYIILLLKYKFNIAEIKSFYYRLKHKITVFVLIDWRGGDAKESLANGFK